MARVITEPDELDLRTKIKAAQVAKTEVTIDPWQLSRLAYGFFEYQKIQAHLDSLKDWTRATRSPASLAVARLAGIAHAVTRMADVGIVPVDLYKHICDELRAYQEWAHLNCDGAAVSDQEMRTSIHADVALTDTWSSWARGVLDPDHSGCPLSPLQMIQELQGLLDHRAAMLAAGTQDRLEGALEVEDGWFRWAQEALGLSDAYVMEQKLTVDDLRRMISGRL